MLEFLKNGKGDILNFFFKNPDGVYYFREIAKSLNKEPAYYQRHLDDLVESGILSDERRGNLRFFKLNKNHPLYDELRSIISKTLGVQFKLKDLVNKYDTIEAAFIFGSIASNQENPRSDIDLMIIGSVNEDLLIVDVNLLEQTLGREINYHIYTKDEIKKKLDGQDNFFTEIFNNPIIILKGNIDELRKS